MTENTKGEGEDEKSTISNIYNAISSIGNWLCRQKNSYSVKNKRSKGIWNNVFEKCTNLEDVVFQEGCKYIGKNVFTNCSNLQKVTLPKSLL